MGNDNVKIKNTQKITGSMLITMGNN